MLNMLPKKYIKKLRNDVFCYNQRILYHAVIRWLRYFFATEVLHLKQLNQKMDKPLIIVGNHASGWDPFLAFSSIDKWFFKKNIAWRIPVYHEIYNKIHFKPFFKFIGAYPIKGEGTLEKSLEKTLSIIDRGHNTIFFPEGKRILEGESAKPKKGIGYIVEHRDVYILPAFVEYSSRGRKGVGARFGSKARIVFGGVYDSQYFRDRYTDERLHYGVMDSVNELRGAFEKNSVSIKKSAVTVEI